MGFCGDFTGWHRLEQLNFEGTLRTLGAGDPGTRKVIISLSIKYSWASKISYLPAQDRKKRNKVTFSQLIKKNINNLPKFPFYTAGKQNRFPLSSPHTSAGVQAMLPTLSWHHCRCAILLNGYSVTIIPLCIEVCERTVRG